MVVELLGGVGALAVAGYFLFVGGRKFHPVYHILSNDPIPVRDLDTRSGPVEIEGQAVADEDTGTVTAPFTGTECLAYTYEVEELQSSGKNSNWRSLDTGMDGVDFLVEDDTGRVRVDPDGATLRFEEHTIELSPGDELPERIERYVQATEEVDKQDGTVNLVVTEVNTGNKQRFTERRLDVGESVYVYGQATRDAAPSWGSSRVGAIVGNGSAAPIFVISDTSEQGTARRFAKDGLLWTAVGLAVSAAGIYLILFV